MEKLQSTSCSGSSGREYFFFDEEEMEVCQILLGLPDLVAGSENRRRRFEVTWAGKRKRSALDSAATSTSLSPRHRLLLEDGKTDAKILGGVKAAEATSPSTPLSFFPSDSDDKYSKLHSHKKILKKRTKEELVEMIDELRNHGQSLRTAHQTTPPPNLVVVLPSSSSSNGAGGGALGLSNQMPPRVIPDLNFSPEVEEEVGCSQPLDSQQQRVLNNRRLIVVEDNGDDDSSKRLRAKEARRKRRNELRKMRRRRATATAATATATGSTAATTGSTAAAPPIPIHAAQAAIALAIR